MRNRGFTLIELVVTIALVSVLAVSLSIKIVGIFDKAKVSEVKHNLSILRSAIDVYEVENGTLEFEDVFTDKSSDIKEAFHNYFPKETLPTIKSGTNLENEKKGILNHDNYDFFDGKQNSYRWGYNYIETGGEPDEPEEAVILLLLESDTYGADIDWSKY